MRIKTMANFLLEEEKLAEYYTIPMVLHCPQCGERHIDEQDFAEIAHHTHACQGCGFVWRPAKVNTHGVHFLPGYKNGARTTAPQTRPGKVVRCPVCQDLGWCNEHRPPQTAEPSDAGDFVPIPVEVYEFLMGHAPLEGRLFGDRHPERPGAFWWRSVIRERAAQRKKADG